MSEFLTTDRVPQLSPLLGRNLVHDRRSRGFALEAPIDQSRWRSRNVRVIDPIPNPRQRVGSCTGCAEAMMLNSSGNRQLGRVLDMDDAELLYSLASFDDPWPGGWPPEDTGSSGLAAAKAAQRVGWGAEYFWEFRGADGVVEAIQQGRALSVGTWWYASMMDLDSSRIVSPRGGIVGGHQYLARGYDKTRDLVLCRCWWGVEFRDFWISRLDLDALLRDGGDAHWTRTAVGS
jgi:hypothetical protein